MKITRDRALEVTAYCRKHKLTYANQGTYPNTRRAAERAGIRSPGGMLLHFPRNATHNGKVWVNPRAYVCWYGESIDAIEEACAFILMTRQDKPSICILRCSDDQPPESRDNLQLVIDEIDSRED